MNLPDTVLHNVAYCNKMIWYAIKEKIMSSVAIRLSKEFINQAEKYAKINMRTVPKQIEYWAMLGRCAEDNPDLSLDVIKDCLLAQEEVKQGQISAFEFRNE